MSQLFTEIVCHERCRIIDCCLCGRSWDEQWVGVRLADGTEALGSLCPACLSRTPQDMAALFGQHGAALRAAFPHASPEIQEPSETLNELQARVVKVRTRMLRFCATARRLLERSAALQEEASRLRREFAEALAVRASLIADARRLTQALPADSPAAAATWLNELEETATEADALLALSDHLARMVQWPTSVRAVMQAERAEFLEHFPELGTEYAQHAVDDRYIAFLAGTA
jgi:hypothetical protein